MRIGGRRTQKEEDCATRRPEHKKEKWRMATEVADPKVAVLRDEEVGWLQVAVEDPAGVEVAYAAHKLVHKMSDVVHAELLGALRIGAKVVCA